MIPHNFSEKLLYAATAAYSRLRRNGLNNAENIKNIVAVKWDEIGDLCYALGVFDALKSKYPGCKIQLICKPFALSLVAEHPSIDEVATDFNKLPAQIDLWLELRGTSESLFKAMRAHPRIFLDRASVRLSNKKKGGHPHETITNLQILEPLTGKLNVAEFFPKLHPSSSSQSRVENWLKEERIGKYVVFHPGARRVLRQWSPERFGEIGNYIFNRYGYQVVLIGDASEQDLLAAIQAQLPSASKVFPASMGLDGLSALLARASFYLGNESGPLCMAAVSDIPCLGLFGPGEPKVFYPPGPKSRYIHHVLDCNPCDQLQCKYPENSCMNRIQTQDVKILIDELLNDTKK
ncbi:MAG: glycosyltransferase family 9 protein [Bacteroidetes bacterium]|nr:glycosyltransferase family 9 protein [Bacteroidota bacterium]